MKYVADLQIHSRFSRATSKNITLGKLEEYAKIKGINLLGTGDFTHPQWIQEIKKELSEDGTGLLTSKTGFKFMLQGEISNIYTQDGKGRRIHNLLFAKDIDTVMQIQEKLLTKGRIDYDGRPIFGFSCIELVEMMKSISQNIEIIPAHIMTPWFGLFGSKSGFDSLKQAYGDQTKHIHAVETGLSADPGMLGRMKQLDKLQIVSNSDAHSFWPWRMGRECTIYDIENYDDYLNAIRTGKGLIETIECDPNYGKYHVSGHRNCNVSMLPQEEKKHKGICPQCSKPLVEGVMNRIEQLADRTEQESKSKKPFINLIPLSEIICAVRGITLTSKKSWNEYFTIIKEFGSEFHIMRKAEEKDLRKKLDVKLVDAIIKTRNQEVRIKPGYDGVYGKPEFD